LNRKKQNIKIDLNCPNCASDSIIKKGTRKNKFRNVQIYLCKDCNKKFSSEKFKNKTYTLKTQLAALSKYSLGYTIEEISLITTIPKSTVANWINEHKKLFNIFNYSTPLQNFSKEKRIIKKHMYLHGLVYLYQQNNFKLERFIKEKEPRSHDYLQKAGNGKIDTKIFVESNARASRAKLNINDLKLKQAYNNACKLANIAIELVNDNRKRHDAVEKLMLENDTSTIAVEVPVFLQLSNSSIPWIKKIKPSNNYITGHIDLLQYRNKKLYILDYKPGAVKEKPLGQLFIYACCISKSTGIHFNNMKLAWFDDKNYFETDAMEIYKFVMKNFR
jgi:transposase-like protein